MSIYQYSRLQLSKHFKRIVRLAKAKKKCTAARFPLSLGTPALEQKKYFIDRESPEL